jgi:hypothetical protein
MTSEQQALAQVVADIEQRLFADLLDPADATRLRSDRRAWHYRPSHHIRRGLCTPSDIIRLQQPGARLLSIGAWPLVFERTLLELGVPVAHLMVADSDPDILTAQHTFEARAFDLTQVWPLDLGTFDLIIFPESLCIALTDCLRQQGQVLGAVGDHFPADEPQAELLARVCAQALAHLRGGGEIRADGPMPHPKVVQRASQLLLEAGWPHTLRYERYLLQVQAADSGAQLAFP